MSLVMTWSLARAGGQLSELVREAQEGGSQHFAGSGCAVLAPWSV